MSEGAGGDSDLPEGESRTLGQSTERAAGQLARFFETWDKVEKDFSCAEETDVGGCTGTATVCGTARFVTEAVGNPEEFEVLPTIQQGTRTDRTNGTTQNLGLRCYAVRAGGPAGAGEVVVITVTQEDFAALPVQPAEPHAGPPDGWVPVNMDVVLHAEAEEQTLSATILDVPVQIRAIPIRYTWDMGDGNTITTAKAGEPYPSKEVVGTFAYEGWYDITLTTTYAGQFSVAGGPWQDIEGTIDVASEPVPLFSKSLESRLVDGEAPIDAGEDPWVPERTADTEGPQDPEASERTV